MPHASKYEDYKETKKNIESLEPIIENLVKDWTLCHIDAVCDNFFSYRKSRRISHRF